MFWSQLKKDLMSLRGEAILLTGIILLWDVFLHTRIGLWDPWLVFPLGWLPLTFVPLWIAWTSVHLYHQEWSANTHYLMLSLPVRAWCITLSKLAAIIIGALGYSVVIAVGGLTLLSRAGGSIGELKAFLDALPGGWLIVTAVQMGAVALLGSLFLGVITQFAYLFSRLFERFQWLLMAWTWILSFWMWDRFESFVGPLLGWLPDFTIRSVEARQPGDHRASVDD